MDLIDSYRFLLFEFFSVFFLFLFFFQVGGFYLPVCSTYLILVLFVFILLFVFHLMDLIDFCSLSFVFSGVFFKLGDSTYQYVLPI